MHEGLFCHPFVTGFVTRTVFGEWDDPVNSCQHYRSRGGELVDAEVSKTSGLRPLRVRFPPPA